jgi:hypothetical protein
MEGYGIIQISMGLLSYAHSIFVRWLVVIGAIPIVYATLAKKRLIHNWGSKRKKDFKIIFSLIFMNSIYTREI